MGPSFKTGGRAPVQFTGQTKYNLDFRFRAAMLSNAPVAVPYGYDPVLYNDPAILEDLLQTQGHYAPHPFYCPDIQPNIEFEMRRIIVEWLRDVCTDANFLEGLPNSVQMLDRYLSKPVAKPDPNDLQLLAAACMFITSKIKAVEPMSAATVVSYTDNFIELEQLLIVELHIAKALDWDLVGVTVYDVTFTLIRYLQRDLVIGELEAGLLLGQAQLCLMAFLLDHESLRYPVSHLAAASVHYLAWRELNLSQHDLLSIEQRLLKLMHVDPSSQSWLRSRNFARRCLQQHLSEQPVGGTN